MGETIWEGLHKMSSRRYRCGYCGNSLVSEQAFFAKDRSTSQPNAHIYICHFCQKPTYFDAQGKQTPGYPYGGKVDNIQSKNVEALYEEARNCISCGAYTAAVMCSRKLLMNIAVSKGAKERLPFVTYVNFLAKNGYVPPEGKDYLSHIKDKGNEANHVITIRSREEAEDLIDFLEMVLKFIYTFPAKLRKRKELKEAQSA